MQLSVEQSRKALADYGCYVAEACDRCGNLLGAVRYSRRGEPGDWCSQLCRDGEPAKPIGICHGCRAPLTGKRKGTKFCGDTCRKRDAKRNVQDHPNYPGIALESKPLTEAGEGFGYPHTESLAKAPTLTRST
jgi:hypothetical protein